MKNLACKKLKKAIEYSDEDTESDALLGQLFADSDNDEEFEGFGYIG